MSSVLLFVGDEQCGHCQAFKSEWKKILEDKDMRKNLILKSIIADQARKIDLPPPLEWVRAVPLVMIVSYDVYVKFFDPVNDIMINSKGNLTGKAYTGTRTHAEVRKWALRQ